MIFPFRDGIFLGFPGCLLAVSCRYMLLGVLVDVIGAVASTEKQKIEITFIAG